jgi:uncharacterized repeat protein (TIGR02543 family)
MNTQKLFGYGLLAVILALSLIGCPVDDKGGGGDDDKDITYTAVQVGGTDYTATSTGIKFTFSASVDSLGLTADDITVSGAPATKGVSATPLSGTSWTLPITVTAPGFVTVSINKDGIEKTQKNVTVYKEGAYVPEYWTITWNLNGGEKGAGAYPAQIVKGEVLAKPSPDPTKGGNTFGGWYTNSGLTTAYDFSVAVTANLNLYAKWETGSQTEYWSVTWELNGGTAGTGAYPTQIEKSAVLTKPSPDPTKADNTFDGWYTDSDLTTAYNFSSAVTTNLSLYAKWNINQYTVTFNSNGGSNVTAQTVDHGSNAAEPQNVTREYHTLAGWYEDNTAFQNQWNFTTNTVTQDITLYAKWLLSPEFVPEMVSVQGGSFEMGETGIATPVHTVTLTSFYIGKYEVTQAQWQAVMGSLPSQLTTGTNYGRGDNYPMYYIDWYMALVFCNKLSIAEGLTPAYRVADSTNPDDWPTSFTPTIDNNANGYRLPTEAQWEYAAEGGNPLAAGWVDYIYSGSNTPADVAWFNNNGGINTTKVVGTKAANGLGIYDMSGNVQEWCWDRFGNYTNADETDPTGASSGTERVIRGGSYGVAAQYIRSTYRNSGSPSGEYNGTGFRLARPAN